MNKSFKLIGGALALMLSTTSCVDDGFFRSDWDTPSIACNTKFGDANTTLADIVAKATNEGQFITEDLIFEGYVSSSDETGNIYKTIYIQDASVNPTVGLAISLDKTNTYADYPVGTKLSINAKGLYIAKNGRGAVPTIGSKGTNANYPAGYIAAADIDSHIAKACVNGTFVKEEIVPVELSSLSEAKNDKYINILVKVSDVQFRDADGKLTYIEGNANTERTLVGKDNHNTVIRSSQYASFKSEVLPTGSGDITFIVGKYNTTYQMAIRSTADVNFTNERFGETTQEPTTPETPAEGTRPNTSKGGTNITYLGAGTSIDFESYATGANSEPFPEFYNDAVLNNIYWRVASFGNNKYIQISAFNRTTPQPETKNYFVVPVDFDNMSAFSFKSKDGYTNGDVLKVYYSTDYTPTNANPTLVEITSSFAISNAGTATGYATDFTESGDWTKPSTLTGKGFIIFEYHGGAGANLPTTTMQIDDITIK